MKRFLNRCCAGSITTRRRPAYFFLILILIEFLTREVRHRLTGYNKVAIDILPKAFPDPVWEIALPNKNVTVNLASTKAQQMQKENKPFPLLHLLAHSLDNRI